MDEGCEIVDIGEGEVSLPPSEYYNMELEEIRKRNYPFYREVPMP